MVQSGSNRHSRKLESEVLNVASGEEGVHFSGRHKCYFIGVVRILDLLTCLGEVGYVGETQTCYIGSSSCEFLCTEYLGCTFGPSNMVGEVVEEVVPIVGLSIQSKHSNEVGTGYTVSQELETEPRYDASLRLGGVGLGCEGETDQAVVSSGEDTSVGRARSCYELYFADIAY